jgi:enoyl-CoA hydratase/carnithine racemase
MILGGATIDARAALAAGLVTRVVPDGALDAELPGFVERYARHSGAALALAREAMGRGPAFLAALARAEELYLGRLMDTHDANEGIAAWLGKRPPHWEHR